MDIIKRKCGCIEHYVGFYGNPKNILSSRDSKECMIEHKSIEVGHNG